MVDLPAAQQLDFGQHDWSFTERDVILYALSVGASWEEGRYVYENHEDFAALPTFAVLPLHSGALAALDLSAVLPNFNPVRKEARCWKPLSKGLTAPLAAAFLLASGSTPGNLGRIADSKAPRMELLCILTGSASDI